MSVTQPTDHEIEAANLVDTTLTTHGSGTLSCDCGGWKVYIDTHALSSYVSYRYALTRQVVDLIEHARYDHAICGAILFTAPIIVFRPTRNGSLA